MPDGNLCYQIIAEILIFLVCALITAVRVSLAELSEARIKRMAEEEGSSRAARLDALLERYGNRLSEPMSVFFYALLAAGAVLFGAIYAENAGFLPIARPLEIAVYALVCAALFFTFAYFLPMAIARFRPEKCALSLTFFIRALSMVTMPLVVPCRLVAAGFARLCGVDAKHAEDDVTEEDIRLLVDIGEESGAIESTEREMIENVFEFNNLTAADVMTHRTDMDAISKDATPEEIFELIKETGFSRFPVYENDIDEVTGVLFAREFLLAYASGMETSLAELMHEAWFIPEQMRVDLIFNYMQSQNVHMAIVLDEYGGTSGLVTLEDLLEKIVGEIYDETDDEESQDIEQIEENLWRIRGSADLETVVEALSLEDAEFDEEDAETLGGLVFSRLDIIPDDGDCPEIEAMGMHIKVETLTDRRVESALVSKLQPEEEEETEEE